MALSSRIAWEVRVGGSANSGGGFDPGVGVPGTDFSQQAAAQVLRTDLVIAGSTLTSAALPFQATEVGNLIHITAGTGFTVGFYTIISLSGVTATLDRSPGTNTSTGGTGRVGGALARPDTVDGIAIGGNVIWIQAGAGYSPATTIALTASGADGTPLSFIGYTTVRGDNGLATFAWAGAGNGTVLSFAGTNNIIRNLAADGNAFSADTGLIASGGTSTVVNCFAKNCRISGITVNNQFILAYRCAATNNGVAGSAGSGGFTVGGSSLCHSCESYSNVGNGFMASNVQARFVDCLARSNTKSGFYSFGSGGTSLYNCTSYGNTLDGLRLDGSPESQNLELFNALFAGNTGWGVNSVATDYTLTPNAQQPLARNWNSAFYNNTAGNRFQWPAGNGDIVLSADPFTSAATLDFSLNGTAGGGASLRGAGVPGGIGLLTTLLTSAGHADVGAFQGLAVAAASSNTTTMRSLWRELTNERFTGPVPDSPTVDIYLDWGLQYLNRAIRYHVSDTTIALVASQQEYSLPGDFVEVVFAKFAGFKWLQKGEVDRWRNRGEAWQDEAPAEPIAFAVYSNKLILRPAPSAEAVTAGPTLALRYCSTPPTITTNGPEQLSTQDQRVAVLWAAYLWSVAYPESLVAQQRIAELKKEVDLAVAAITADYAKRNIST